MPIFVIIATVWFSTKYLIMGHTLVIKINPYIERKVEIDKINSIKKSRNIIASPANSLDRIEINYKDGMVLLSPMQQEDFFYC
ncbi:MAG: PH domain-containing protein [Cyclobacteriaceae bacterium]|nr:PH domain-containing protein [Cyclobacteriaceae bacterium]